MATTDEVLLKVGVDGSKVQAGMTDISNKLSKQSQNLIKQSQEQGEQSGAVFSKGFGKMLLGKVGIGAAVMQALNAVKEKYMEFFADSKIGKAWFELWHGNRSAKEAEEALMETERKVAEKLKEKIKERQELRKKEAEEFQKNWLKHADERNKREEDNIKWLKEQRDLKKKILDLDADIASQQQAIADSRHNFRFNSLQGYMPSLDQLAGAGWMRRGVNLENSPFRFQAREILNLGDFATEAFGYGNAKGGEQAVNKRNRLYDQLADRGIVGQRQDRIDVATINAEKHLAALVEQKATLLVQAKAAE